MRNKCALCDTFSLKYLFTFNKFKIYQCLICKAARVLPWPDKKVLEKYYDEFKYETGFITEKLIRKEARQFLKGISQSKGDLLDIGCGAGFYLDEAKKVGWKVTGVEMSKQLADYATRKFNMPVIVGDFVKVKLPAKKFDVIVLSQVIEHLTDPKPMFNKIRLYLKNNGLFYIATPNIESWLFKVQRQNFPYMIPPEHVYFYSPQSITLLLKQNGFIVKSLSTFGYQQDFAVIIKTVIKSKSSSMQNTNPIKNREYPKESVKLFKYILFDKIFCGILHPTLNINKRGSIIKLIAKKA